MMNHYYKKPSLELLSSTITKHRDNTNLTCSKLFQNKHFLFSVPEDICKYFSQKRNTTEKINFRNEYIKIYYYIGSDVTKSNASSDKTLLQINIL